ncbi:hypothetical protein MNBD_PLANCTO03-2092 [hydrothermal vent metagenome]|uniref:Protein kinase domain-containing protein n=1 Tax=hydrothermal vent metagenome TaxID=652676 RepID=A0A3B1DW36_9ZZZZ
MRSESEVFASVLIDLAESVRIAPRILPETVGPGGRYRLEELVGIGHDSHVYRAIDLHLSKPDVPALVALKIRSSQSCCRIEAIIGRSVSCEYVVRTLDHGVLEDGATYIVQEWISGGDLGDLVLPMPRREAVGLVSAIARGVQALHTAGNIHGDLKPANILRDASGVPKVADFDMARASDLGDESRGGNVAFMAPERVLKPETPPSPSGDIFALGCMLSYFLTGDLPFGQDFKTIEENHRGGFEPTLRGVGKDLESICRRAMSRDIQARYTSAEMLANDLDRWGAHLPLEWTQPSVGRKMALLCRRHPLRVGLLVVLAVAVIAAGGWARASAMRDLDARQQAIAIAEAEIEAQNMKARETIKSFVNSGAFGNGVRNGASVFETLAWVEMLADTSVLGVEGPLLAREERISNLLRVRGEFASTHQSGGLTDSMAAYSLAYCFLDDGQSEEAAEQLAAARGGVLGSLPETDDARRSMDALGVLIEYERARLSGGPRVSELRKELGRLRREFVWIDSKHSVGRLLQAVLDREPAENRGRPGGGTGSP